MLSGIINAAMNGQQAVKSGAQLVVSIISTAMNSDTDEVENAGDDEEEEPLLPFHSGQVSSGNKEKSNETSNKKKYRNPNRDSLVSEANRVLSQLQSMKECDDPNQIWITKDGRIVVRRDSILFEFCKGLEDKNKRIQSLTPIIKCHSPSVKPLVSPLDINFNDLVKKWKHKADPDSDSSSSDEESDESEDDSDSSSDDEDDDDNEEFNDDDVEYEEDTNSDEESHEKNESNLSRDVESGENNSHQGGNQSSFVNIALGVYPNLTNRKRRPITEETLLVDAGSNGQQQQQQQGGYVSNQNYNSEFYEIRESSLEAFLMVASMVMGGHDPVDSNCAYEFISKSTDTENMTEGLTQLIGLKSMMGKYSDVYVHAKLAIRNIQQLIRSIEQHRDSQKEVISRLKDVITNPTTEDQNGNRNEETLTLLQIEKDKCEFLNRRYLITSELKNAIDIINWIEQNQFARQRMS